MKDTENTNSLERINASTTLQFSFEPDRDTLRTKELLPEAANAVQEVLINILGNHSGVVLKDSSFKPFKRIQVNKCDLFAKADEICEAADSLKEAAKKRNPQTRTNVRLPQVATSR